MEKEDLQQETVSIKREKKKKKKKTHGSRDVGERERESLASKDTAPWESFGERESDARH